MTPNCFNQEQAMPTVDAARCGGSGFAGRFQPIAAAAQLRGRSRAMSALADPAVPVSAARLAELEEQERRYRALFDSMDEGFCIIEFLDGPHGPLSDYLHIEANAAYTANAGIPDIVGTRVREVVGDEAEDWIRRYRDVLESGTPVRFERELEATGRYLSL